MKLFIAITVGAFLMIVTMVAKSSSSGLVRDETLSFVNIDLRVAPYEEDESTTREPIGHINSTLDSLDTNGTVPTGWETSTNIEHYLEYYNNTAEFKNLQDNEGSCAHYMSKEKLNALSDVNGIWVACQDQSQPSDCGKGFDQYAPCNAFIRFDSKTSANPALRTIKVSFAVEELAILRLTVKGTCTDYGRRIDPYSPCQFIQTKDEDANHGWHKIRFSFYPDLNGVFGGFTLQLITRFQHDVILIDKVETTDYLLCGPLGAEINCPTPPTTPRPTYTTTTSNTTTTPPTTDPIITDPWEDSTTPPPSASSIVESVENFTAFMSLFCLYYNI